MHVPNMCRLKVTHDDWQGRRYNRGRVRNRASNRPRLCARGHKSRHRRCQCFRRGECLNKCVRGFLANADSISSPYVVILEYELVLCKFGLRPGNFAGEAAEQSNVAYEGISSSNGLCCWSSPDSKVQFVRNECLPSKRPELLPLPELGNLICRTVITSQIADHTPGTIAAANDTFVRLRDHDQPVGVCVAFPGILDLGERNTLGLDA